MDRIVEDYKHLRELQIYVLGNDGKLSTVRAYVHSLAGQTRWGKDVPEISIQIGQDVYCT